MTSLFAEGRSFRSTAISAEATLRRWNSHEITLGLEGAVSRVTRRQLWRPLQTPYVYDLAVNPREYAGYLIDRLRFGDTTMSFGLRSDLHDPGGAVWGDVYHTFGDSRVVQEYLRQLMIQGGGDSKGVRLISPYFSVSYPHKRFTMDLTFGTSYRYLTLEDLSVRSTPNAGPFTDGSTASLRPLRTTTLETGIGTTVKGMLVHVTAFYRDTERSAPAFGPDVLPQTLSNFSGYWGPIDAGLRRQSGMTASLIIPTKRLRRTRNLNGRLSYLWLRNTGSAPSTDYPLQPGSDLQPGDFTTFDPRVRFFWNRQHYLSSVVSLRVPSGLTATAVVHLKSGTPYQRSINTNAGTGSSGQAAVTRFGPWNGTVDGRVDLPFHLKAHMRPVLTLNIEVRNLLNRANINNIPDPRWYETTGQPDNPILDQRQWSFGPARSLWAGLGFGW